MASENIVTITTDNFEAEVLQSSIPVLIDFWADWCGPCKALAPTLDEIADEMVGQVKIAKLNTQHHPKVAQICKVRALPTLLLYKGGSPQGQIVGLVPKQKIVDLIQPAL